MLTIHVADKLRRSPVEDLLMTLRDATSFAIVLAVCTAHSDAQQAAPVNIFKDAGPSTPVDKPGAAAAKATPPVPLHPLATAVNEVNARALRLAANMPTTGNPLAAPVGFWRASSVVKAVTDPAAVPAPLLKELDAFVTSRGRDAVGSGTQFRTAAALWTTTGGTIDPALAKRVSDGWATHAKILDLTNRATAARDLDDWVVQNTSGNLAKNVSAPRLSGAPPAVITDAARFEVDWQQPFDKSETKYAPFKAADGSSADARLMRLATNLPYVKNAEVELVVIPFTAPITGGDSRPAEFGFAVLLPPPGRDVKAMAADITPTKFKAWFDEAIVSDDEMKAWEETAPTSTLESDNEAWMKTYPLKAVSVTLPRFTAKSPATTDVKWQAEAAGPAALFVQGVEIEINEAGAGDVAGGAGGPSGGVVGEPVAFEANRPFLFTVVERATGAIVLVGQVNGVK